MATEGAAASLKVTPGWLNASTHNSKAINNAISLKNEPINGLLIQPAAPDIASPLLPYMMLDTCGAAGARGRAYPKAGDPRISAKTFFLSMYSLPGAVGPVDLAVRSGFAQRGVRDDG